MKQNQPISSSIVSQIKTNNPDIIFSIGFTNPPDAVTLYRNHIYSLFSLLLYHGHKKHKNKIIKTINGYLQKISSMMTDETKQQIKKSLANRLSLNQNQSHTFTNSIIDKIHYLQYLKKQLTKQINISQTIKIHTEKQKAFLGRAFLIIYNIESSQTNQNFYDFTKWFSYHIKVQYSIHNFFDFQIISFSCKQFSQQDIQVFIEINKKKQNYRYFKQITNRSLDSNKRANKHIEQKYLNSDAQAQCADIIALLSINDKNLGFNEASFYKLLRIQISSEPFLDQQEEKFENNSSSMEKQVKQEVKQIKQVSKSNQSFYYSAVINKGTQVQNISNCNPIILHQNIVISQNNEEQNELSKFLSIRSNKNQKTFQNTQGQLENTSSCKSIQLNQQQGQLISKQKNMGNQRNIVKQISSQNNKKYIWSFSNLIQALYKLKDDQNTHINFYYLGYLMGMLKCTNYWNFKFTYNKIFDLFKESNQKLSQIYLENNNKSLNFKYHKLVNQIKMTDSFEEYVINIQKAKIQNQQNNLKKVCMDYNKSQRKQKKQNYNCQKDNINSSQQNEGAETTKKIKQYDFSFRFVYKYKKLFKSANIDKIETLQNQFPYSKLSL